MTARYTARDPHYEWRCLPCVFGKHDCEKTTTIPKPSIMAGVYNCACFKCRCEKKAS